MRGKCRRIGAGNRTCNGIPSHGRLRIGALAPRLLHVSFYGKYVSLLSDEGQGPAHWRRQQDMRRHVFPIIVDR